MNDEVLVKLSIYGFWDAFGKDNIPLGKKLYFVFAGNIVAGNYCHLTRTMYIGASREADEGLLEKLSPGEVLFYAYGDTNDDVEILRYALINKFAPAQAEDCQYSDSRSIHVMIDGKIPNIYQKDIDFIIPAKKEGAV